MSEGGESGHEASLSPKLKAKAADVYLAQRQVNPTQEMSKLWPNCVNFAVISAARGPVSSRPVWTHVENVDTRNKDLLARDRQTEGVETGSFTAIASSACLPTLPVPVCLMQRKPIMTRHLRGTQSAGRLRPCGTYSLTTLC